MVISADLSLLDHFIDVTGVAARHATSFKLLVVAVGAVVVLQVNYNY